MRHEEKRRTLAYSAAKPSEVEGGDDCLARTGCGYHQVVMMVMNQTFHVQGVQHCLLVGERAHLKP